MAEAILADEALDGAELNALAADSTARVELVVTGRGPRRRLVWTDASLAAALARRLVEELAALDPDRLRRCAGPECDLLFYDTTRSRTRRWHAEDPCGWRERQRVHRTRQAVVEPDAAAVLTSYDPTVVHHRVVVDTASATAIRPD